MLPSVLDEQTSFVRKDRLQSFQFSIVGRTICYCSKLDRSSPCFNRKLTISGISASFHIDCKLLAVLRRSQSGNTFIHLHAFESDIAINSMSNSIMLISRGLHRK
jgi:hypothetical protein